MNALHQGQCFQSTCLRFFSYLTCVDAPRRRQVAHPCRRTASHRRLSAWPHCHTVCRRRVAVLPQLRRRAASRCHSISPLRAAVLPHRVGTWDRRVQVRMKRFGLSGVSSVLFVLVTVMDGFHLNKTLFISLINILQTLQKSSYDIAINK
jgi:hypothetical protein